MKVIVFASAKGGVGKTTLSFNCAIYAALQGKSVYLMDRDPAEALTRICKKRKSDGDLAPDNPERLEGALSVVQAVAQIRNGGFERDYLIVDTPNAFVQVIRDAIAAADCIVLPVEASPIDLEVNEAAVDEVRKLGKRDRAVYVVNPADRTSLTKETKVLLARLSPNEPQAVSQRVDYRRNLIEGVAAVETNVEAKAEIAKLWKAIEKVLGHENAKSVEHATSAERRH